MVGTRRLLKIVSSEIRLTSGTNILGNSELWEIASGECVFVCVSVSSWAGTCRMWPMCTMCVCVFPSSPYNMFFSVEFTLNRQMSRHRHEINDYTILAPISLHGHSISQITDFKCQRLPLSRTPVEILTPLQWKSALWIKQTLPTRRVGKKRGRKDRRKWVIESVAERSRPTP